MRLTSILRRLAVGWLIFTCLNICISGASRLPFSESASIQAVAHVRKPTGILAVEVISNNYERFDRNHRLSNTGMPTNRQNYILIRSMSIDNILMSLDNTTGANRLLSPDRAIVCEEALISIEDNSVYLLNCASLDSSIAATGSVTITILSSDN